jgi:hypothetical protein
MVLRSCLAHSGAPAGLDVAQNREDFDLPDLTDRSIAQE